MAAADFACSCFVLFVDATGDVKSRSVSLHLSGEQDIQLSKYHILVGREEKATFSLGFVETVVCHLSPPL